MKYWVLILVFLLVACSQVDIVENKINETEPITNLTELENKENSIPLCKNSEEFPCLNKEETPDEFNYCETNLDCTFAPKASCDCKPPGSTGKAVNINELERYNSEREEYCRTVDINCPQYSPPGPGYIYYEYEPRCVENVCRTVKTGVLRVVGE